jgi:cysteine synthase
MSQAETVQTIAEVIAKHYVWFDGFSQDDNWACHCNMQDLRKTREEIEQHIARRIEMAIGGRTMVAQEDAGLFWSADAP